MRVNHKDEQRYQAGLHFKHVTSDRIHDCYRLHMSSIELCVVEQHRSEVRTHTHEHFVVEQYRSVSERTNAR